MCFADIDHKTLMRETEDRVAAIGPVTVPGPGWWAGARARLQRLRPPAIAALWPHFLRP